jgi:hypothetical protein
VFGGSSGASGWATATDTDTDIADAATAASAAIGRPSAPRRLDIH